jgi:hypothetical protein
MMQDIKQSFCKGGEMEELSVAYDDGGDANVFFFFLVLGLLEELLFFLFY